MNKTEYFIKRFHNLAVAMGEKAFMADTSIIFYSGPPPELLEMIGVNRDIENYNEGRSEKSMSILNATRINETRLGQWLFKGPNHNIYRTMENIYGREQGIKYADAINIEFSKLFTSHAEGRVFTAVCGAAKERIFRTHELPELIANSKVTHVNGYDADRFRRLFDRNCDMAFRHICQTEQRLMFAVAQNLGTIEAFTDHAERRDLRRADRLVMRDDDNRPVGEEPLKGLAQSDREAFVQIKALKRAIRIQRGAFQAWRPHLLRGPVIT